MTKCDVLAAIEEGLANGRIAPYLADFIVAEILQEKAKPGWYDDRVRLDDVVGRPDVSQQKRRQ